MCRNIKTLFNFEPPATPEEIQAAALQFVRKISGMTRPSQDNQETFDWAVEQITAITTQLVSELTTTASPRDREVEASKARERWRKRAQRIQAQAVD